MRTAIQPKLRAILAALAAVTCCSRAPAGPEWLIHAEDGAVQTRPFTGLPADARPSEATWNGRVRLLGTRVDPPRPKPGEELRVTAWFLLERELLGDWQVFVHASAEGAELNLSEDAQAPLGGAFPVVSWQPGQVLQETRTLRVPNPAPADGLRLYGGLLQGNTRLPVDGAPYNHRDTRVLLAEVPVDGGANAVANVPHAGSRLTLDGSATEPDWKRAPRVGPFLLHDGSGVPSRRTFARMLWTEDALHLHIECEDPDVWSGITDDDGPLQNDEAVVVIIDADRDGRTYQEMVIAPTGAHRDASFTARRRGIHPGFTSGVQSARVLQGTLNNPRDVDRGWAVELRIPWRGLVDGWDTASVGQELGLNLVRVEKPRHDGAVVGNQVSAWSSPLSHDVHNLQRLGRVILGE